jgi:hypothetical protein
VANRSLLANSEALKATTVACLVVANDVDRAKWAVIQRELAEFGKHSATGRGGPDQYSARASSSSRLTD